MLEITSQLPCLQARKVFQSNKNENSSSIMQTHNTSSNGHVQSSCIFSFHVDSPTIIADAIDLFTSDMYFQSWVCSSYYCDNALVADTVGRQWNKSVYGQIERSR